MNFVWVPSVVFRTDTQLDVSASLRSLFRLFLNTSRVCYFFIHRLYPFLCHLFITQANFMPQNFQAFQVYSGGCKTNETKQKVKRMTESNTTDTQWNIFVKVMWMANHFKRDYSDQIYLQRPPFQIKKKENTAKTRYALKNKRSTTKIYNSRPYSVCHTWDNKKIFIHSQIISKKTVSHKRNSARLLCVRVRVYFISSFPLWLLCFRHTIHTAFVVIQLFHFVKSFFLAIQPCIESYTRLSN